MSIFGSTFKPYVIRQISARQYLMQDGTDAFDGKRSLNVQKYTTSKTAWAKMVSFVDYSADPNQPPTNELARKYVLSAGTLVQNPDKPEEYGLRSGIANKNGSYGALGNRDFGYRPMPGIESINVTNKSAFGSLRQATIKFRCWDKKQLDDLEILFMRTGYPVLLEWGWSMYMDTSVNYVSGSTKTDNGSVKVADADLKKFAEKPMKSFDSVTVNPFDVSKDLYDYYDSIAALSENLSGNYDGMVGLIQNFTWELLPDGSYSCTTVLISMGDVLDSIKMNRPAPSQGNINDEKAAYKTLFTQLMSDLVAKRDVLGNANTSTLSNVPEVQKVEGLQTDVFRLEKYANWITSDKTRIEFPSYIQMSHFIALINKVFSLKQNGKPLVNIELPIYGLNGNKGNGLCVASVDSVSIDPTVCIINNPKAKWVTGMPDGYVLKGEFKSNALPYLLDNPQSPTSNLGKIGNIYLNVQHLSDKFNTLLLKSEEGEVHIYKFIKEILDDVAFSLGSVNNFDVYVTDSNAVIIDKNYTELSAESSKDRKFNLNIYGNNTVVRGIKAVSKVFQSQSNLMAIAASNAKLNLGGVNTSTQAYFNRGLKNRLYKISLEEEKKQNVDEKVDKLEAAKNVLSLRAYLQNFLKPINPSFPMPGESVTTSNTVLNSVLLNVNSDCNYRSIIPLTLEVVMDGISGIAIGEIFTVNPDILPSDYDRKDLGFMTTKLRHNIVNSDWTTTIEAYPILLNQDDAEKRKGALSQSEKDNFNQLFVEVTTATQTEYIQYYNAYIKLLNFVKEYYQNNIILPIERKPYYVSRDNAAITYTDETLPDAYKMGYNDGKNITPIESVNRNITYAKRGIITEREFLYLPVLDIKQADYYKPIYLINKPDLNSIIADVNQRDSEGKYIFQKYTGVYIENDFINKKTYILNPLFRVSGSNPNIKQLIIQMVQKSSEFQTLLNKSFDTMGVNLAKDVLDVIERVNNIGNTSTNSGSSNLGTNTTTIIGGSYTIIPYYPFVNPDTNLVTYQRDKGFANPITFTFPKQIKDINRQ